MSDLIRRENAIEAIRRTAAQYVPFLNGVNETLPMECEIALRSVPSAEPKTGEWVDRSEGGRIISPWWESHKCDQCGYFGSGAWNFCSNCGADMRGKQE